MLLVLQVIVEVNVVDCVMNVHVMHPVMLLAVSRLDADQCTDESRRFLGLRKAAMGSVRMAFLPPI